MAMVLQIDRQPTTALSWPYRSANTVMLPYEPKANHIFPEDFLGRLYFKLKEEETLDIVCGGMNITHMNQFVAYLTRVQGLVFCCLQGEKYPVPHPVGFGWLNEINGIDGARTASFTFGFFKEIRGHRTHIELSNFMLLYWLREFKIDRLFATTTNPLALNYAKRFKFDYLCLVPEFFNVGGSLKNVHFITLDRAKFLSYYADWQARHG